VARQLVAFGAGVGVEDLDTGNCNRHPDPNSISSSLLEGIKSRRPEAWTRLVALFGPVAYRWCRLAGVPRDDASDLIQDVFAAVALHVAAFRRDRPGDSFTAWLRTITNNKIRDYYRARRGRAVAQGGTDAQERFLQVPDLPEPSAATDPQEVRGLIMPIGLEMIRGEFEDRTWEAFRRAIEGQAPAEIAADMGMSIQAVYQAKSRVLRRLRRNFEELE
jgi:RNA polymerase sigma-70 factor, ECF subfamily